MRMRKKLRGKVLHTLEIHIEDMTTHSLEHGYFLTHTLAISQDTVTIS